jgi:hypothetical protein
MPGRTTRRCTTSQRSKVCGLRMLQCDLLMGMTGALVVQGTSMLSLSAMAHLTTVSSGGATVTVNGAAYAAVVLSLCAEDGA